MSDSQFFFSPQSTPLAVRMRPTSLNDLVGQKHLLSTGSPLSRLATAKSEGGQFSSVILFGPAGVGKTTLAHIIGSHAQANFVQLSAVTATVAQVREVLEKALQRRSMGGLETILFLDEIHRFTKAQQDVLLPGVENGWVTLIAATTENPSFSVITPLLSRSLVLKLEPLSAEDIGELIDRALSEPRGLDGVVQITDLARRGLIELSSGDARRALTILEAAAMLAQEKQNLDLSTQTSEQKLENDELSSQSQKPLPCVDEEALSRVADRSLLQYDRQGDEHYDVISAFIKSVRGSDVDAALHYLARMIEGGEDERFIARRLIILASEDVGMADPAGLDVAVSAAQAVALIGMPEGRIPLAHATVYLATAPKSNAVYKGIDRALDRVRKGRIGRVPLHLRDSHSSTRFRERLEHGYVYAHDDIRGVVKQAHLPAELEGEVYYEPKEIGNERVLRVRLEKIKRILRGQ